MLSGIGMNDVVGSMTIDRAISATAASTKNAQTGSLPKCGALSASGCTPETAARRPCHTHQSSGSIIITK